MQTSRHQRMDSGAILAADLISFFIISRQENWPLGKKVQYNVVTN